jgi:hypothetical protein
MAIGDTLLMFDPLANRPPTSGYATLDLRGQFIVLDFDASANEQAQFHAVVPRHYRGGDIKVLVSWTSTSATSGNAKLRVELTRLTSSGNLDSLPSVTGSADVVIAAPATNGNVGVAEFAAVAVSDLAAGEMLLVRITRLATDGADTMTGDLELIAVEVKEA